MTLTPSQQAAIEHIERYALSRADKARAIIEEVRIMSNIAEANIELAMHNIRTKACVALHFHPDRLDINNQSVVASLLESGFYKNQFETNISSGKLSPVAGGPRDQWENNLFGGAFARDEGSLSSRPKYGALNLMQHPDGPSPRFGSCYFVLYPTVNQRCTFTYMDSYLSPNERGTANVFEDIFAALLAECFQRHYALGRSITPTELIKHIRTQDLQNCSLQGPPGRILDHYIEAQVHGEVDLRKDVHMLVADPSFQSTNTGNLLAQLCQVYDIRLHWHQGFSMQAANVPPDFRGPTMPSLAQRIAHDGRVNANIIGLAASDLKTNPNRWAERGTYEQCLQELKLLWHVLVKYGT